MSIVSRSGFMGRDRNDLRLEASESNHDIAMRVAHFDHVIERTAGECGIAHEFTPHKSCLLESGAHRSAANKLHRLTLPSRAAMSANAPRRPVPSRSPLGQRAA